MANPCGKTRPVHRPYEVWEGGGWTWNVLKKYQNPTNEAKNDYARWFCQVISPYTTKDGDMGDVYVKDVKRRATLVRADY